jgi:hypothetical protein
MPWGPQSPLALLMSTNNHSEPQTYLSAAQPRTANRMSAMRHSRADQADIQTHTSPTQGAEGRYNSNNSMRVRSDTGTSFRFPTSGRTWPCLPARNGAAARGRHVKQRHSALACRT